MNCAKCGERISSQDVKPAFRQAFQVRAGYVDERGDFVPEEDVGYYCSHCLAQGV